MSGDHSPHVYWSQTGLCVVWSRNCWLLRRLWQNRILRTYWTFPLKLVHLRALERDPSWSSMLVHGSTLWYSWELTSLRSPIFLGRGRWHKDLCQIEHKLAENYLCWRGERSCGAVRTSVEMQRLSSSWISFKQNWWKDTIDRAIKSS